MNSLSDVWKTVLDRLKKQLSDTTINTWFDEVTVVTMEDSALVIVDFDKAIEDGFVSISKDFMEQYGKEHGHDAG